MQFVHFAEDDRTYLVQRGGGSKGPPSAPPTIPPIIINPFSYHKPSPAIDPHIPPVGPPIMPPSRPDIRCPVPALQ